MDSSMIPSSRSGSDFNDNPSSLLLSQDMTFAFNDIPQNDTFLSDQFQQQPSTSLLLTEPPVHGPLLNHSQQQHESAVPLSTGFQIDRRPLNNFQQFHSAPLLPTGFQISRLPRNDSQQFHSAPPLPADFQINRPPRNDFQQLQLESPLPTESRSIDINHHFQQLHPEPSSSTGHESIGPGGTELDDLLQELQLHSGPPWPTELGSIRLQGHSQQNHQSALLLSSGFQIGGGGFEFSQQQPSAPLSTAWSQYPDLSGTHDPPMATPTLTLSDAPPDEYLAGLTMNSGANQMITGPGLPSWQLSSQAQIIDPSASNSTMHDLPLIRRADNNPATIQWHTCRGGCDGFNCIFRPNEALPFYEKNEIGEGGFGTVYAVRSTVTGTNFAVKEMSETTTNRTNDLNDIAEEIRIHRGLRHKHITKIVGTYIYEKMEGRNPKAYFGIVMQPLADCDLSTFLRRIVANRQSGISVQNEDLDVLMDSFGCLASSLAYLHNQKIKHKDIKPANILVYNGTVFLSDFGLSKDFSESGNSISLGAPDGTVKVSRPCRSTVSIAKYFVAVRRSRGAQLGASP